MPGKTQDQQMLLKLNYGIIGVPIQNMDVVFDYWYHTFIVPITPRPPLSIYRMQQHQIPPNQYTHRWSPIRLASVSPHATIEMRTEPNCSLTGFNQSLATDCPPYDNLNVIAAALKMKNARHLDYILDQFEENIPEMPQNQPRRRIIRKSGWDTFLNVIGIASNNDLETIYNNLQLLQHHTQAGFDHFAKTVDNFHSFMKVTTDHQTRVSSILKHHQQAMHQIQNNVNAAVSFLFGNILRTIEYMDAYAGLQELEHNLLLLYNNQLPHSFVTPHDIRTVMADIKQHLLTYKIPLHLIPTNPKQIYDFQQFVLTRRLNQLFITLQFPLSPTPVDLVLYKIVKLQMPVDNQHLHSSVVLNTPDYIAYSPDSDFYLEFSEQPILYKGLYHMQANPMALQHKRTPTCIIAIMELSREAVSNLCHFAIQTFSAQPLVTNLGPGHLLLQFISQYTLLYPNNTETTHSGCDICTLQLPCSTQFKAGSFHFHSRIAHCTPDNHTMVVAYPINLPYLDKYFNTQDLLPDHTQLLDELPILPLPNLTISSSQYAADMGLLQSSILDMQTVVDKAANDSQIFAAISDQIVYDIKTHQIDFGPISISARIETFLTFLNPIISILALLTVLHLFCKWRQLTTALSLFTGLGSKAQAASLKKRIWDAQPMLASFTVNPLQLPKLPTLAPINMTDNAFRTGLIVILIFILIALILKCCAPPIYRCIKRCKPKPKIIPNRDHSFTIQMDVANQTTTFSIPLITLPFDVNHYHINMPNPIAQLNIQGIISKELTFQWIDFQITSRFANFKIDIPPSFPLTSKQADDLQRLLKHPHYILVHAVDQAGHTTIIPTTPPTIPLANAPNPAHTLSSPPPLYPTLIPRVHV